MTIMKYTPEREGEAAAEWQLSPRSYDRLLDELKQEIENGKRLPLRREDGSIETEDKPPYVIIYGCKVRPYDTDPPKRED